jgi:hypothetical protein
MTQTIALAILAGLCLLAQPGAAQTTAAAPFKGGLNYKPAANADLTSNRVGAGVRGPDGTMLSIIAPDHAGTTLSDQPRLYWFISRQTDLPVEIMLMEDGKDDPAYEFATKGAAAGFQCLDLGKQNVKLDLNKRYQLIVKVVDARNHKNDLIASGYVKRVKPSDALANARAQGKEKTELLLTSGIWYDGIAELMQLIETHKDDAELAAARDSLLAQVGLGDLVARPRASM